MQALSSLHTGGIHLKPSLNKAWSSPSPPPAQAVLSLCTRISEASSVFAGGSVLGTH